MINVVNLIFFLISAWYQVLSIYQVAEYEQMAKDINRSAYTQRILEIVSNIRKQNQDIDKVSGFPVHC